MLISVGHPISLPEPFNTAAGVNQFLLAGKEWMALGAYFNPNLFLGGAGCKSFPTCTPDHCFTILWMYIWFQLFHLFRDLVQSYSVSKADCLHKNMAFFNFYSITQGES
jgi:hypothetical protein